MVIIHVSVHLGLSSNIIISHVWYASIIIITDVHLVIFRNGAQISLGSNTINDKRILTKRFHCAATALPLRCHCAATVLPLLCHCSTTALPLRCHCATPSYKRVMIGAILLWITFFDKIRGGTVSCLCWSGLLRCAIGFHISWTSVNIGITYHCPFT